MVYSWKTLLVTFAGCGYFIYRLIHFESLIDLVWLIFLGCLIIKGFQVSFSRDAYEADIKRAERGKRVYQKLFGKYAPFVPYIPFYFVLLAWGAAVFVPTWTWLLITLMLSSLVSAIWISKRYRKQLKIEEQQEDNSGSR